MGCGLDAAAAAAAWQLQPIVVCIVLAKPPGCWSVDADYVHRTELAGVDGGCGLCVRWRLHDCLQQLYGLVVSE